MNNLLEAFALHGVEFTGETALRIGKYLYTETAIWTYLTGTWTLGRYDYPTPIDAFRILAKLANGCFDGVDAEAYVKELRED